MLDLLTPLDIVFIILLAILVIRTTVRGFVAEFMAGAAVLGGVLAATLLSGVVAPLLEQVIGVSMWNQVIAFLAIFILVYLIVKLSETWLANAIENAEMENLDKALGFFLGIVEGVLVIFLLLFIIYVQPFFDGAALVDGSFFGAVFSPLFPYAADVILRSQG